MEHLNYLKIYYYLKSSNLFGYSKNLENYLNLQN